MHRIRIVIVDDTPDVRLLMRLTFESDGRFDVVGDAGDAEEATRLCEELLPEALLLDVRMPGLGGDKALPLLRRTCPDTTVVVYTAHVATSDVDALREAGAAAVVPKTLPPRAVVDRVVAALSG